MSSKIERIASVKKEIELLEKELGIKKRELEMLETVFLEDRLNETVDFKTTFNACFRETFGNMTVKEFLSLHPEEIFNTLHIGKKTMLSLFGWMDINNLKFLSVTGNEFEKWYSKRFKNCKYRRGFGNLGV